MCRGTDPDENLHCRQKGGWDDGIEGADAGVGDEIWYEPTRQVGGIHCDEDVDRVGWGEVEDFFAEGGDLRQGVSANCAPC